LSHLVDVNLLLACGWSVHPHHGAANRWLDAVDSFSTCSVTQMGFIRVSMGPGYGASFADAQRVLRAMVEMPTHRFVADTTTANSLPELASHRDVSDAHLIQLAAGNGLKLATLDESLRQKSWAKDLALAPF
jgi:uncharacterized protein